ncbi:MAG: hypothetical protein U0521_16220 [Anaerolineae bacterium]
MRLERALHSTTHELLGQRLEPGRIGGIGSAQIDALALVGIRTVADLTPANEDAALRALNGVDHAESRGLAAVAGRRGQHVFADHPADVDNAHTRYAQ